MAAAFDVEIAKGTWTLESSENFDEYMKAVGVGYAKRLIGNKAKPSQDIEIEDGVWTITTRSALSKVVLKFTPGIEFEETTADGRIVKSIYRIEGSKLIAEQKGEVDSTIIRDFQKDSFIMTLTAKDVICTRRYKKSD